MMFLVLKYGILTVDPRQFDEHTFIDIFALCKMSEKKSHSIWGMYTGILDC